MKRSSNQLSESKERIQRKLSAKKKAGNHISTCSLKRLPPEIRFKIFEQYFSTSTYGELINPSALFLKNIKKPAPNAEDYFSGIEYHKTNSLNSALLKALRHQKLSRIYFEALDAYYRYGTFYMNQYSSQPYWRRENRNVVAQLENMFVDIR